MKLCQVNAIKSKCTHACDHFLQRNVDNSVHHQHHSDYASQPIFFEAITHPQLSMKASGGSGVVRKEQFIQMMTGRSPLMAPPQNIKEAFEVLADKTAANGFIPVATARDVLTTIGDKLTAAEFDEFIAGSSACIDGGNIRFEKLVAQWYE